MEDVGSEAGGVVKGWRSWAACKGMSPSLFFPPDGDTVLAERAKEVCRGCVVRPSCLEAHLGEKFGVFGGTTESERRRIRRQRRKKRIA